MDTGWVPYAMFIATVGLVLVSVGATAISYFLLRAQVDPEVIVYVKHDTMRPSLLSIVIENVGRGAAYDVKFALSRDIPANAWGIEKPSRRATEPMTQGPLITGIPLLAPGERRVINWGQYGGLHSALGTESVKVTASYSSKRHFPWDPADHVTESTLDVESFHRTDASRPPDLRQVDALEEISKHAARVASLLQNVVALAQRPREPDQLNTVALDVSRDVAQITQGRITSDAAVGLDSTHDQHASNAAKQKRSRRKRRRKR
jgi:hypothetical protein